MTDPDRIIEAIRKPEDVDAALRPKALDEFVGQKAARENLRVFIDAARRRGDDLNYWRFSRGLRSKATYDVQVWTAQTKSEAK